MKTEHQKDFEDWVREELLKHELAIEELYDIAPPEGRLHRALLYISRFFKVKR